jgi:hypothetical protein
MVFTSKVLTIAISTSCSALNFGTFSWYNRS